MHPPIEDILKLISENLSTNFPIYDYSSEEKRILEKSVKDGKLSKVKKISIVKDGKIPNIHKASITPPSFTDYIGWQENSYEIIKILFTNASNENLSSLREIDFQEYPTDDHAMSFIVEAIKEGSFQDLQTLNLGRSSSLINDSMKLQVIEAVKNHCPSLTLLDICNRAKEESLEITLKLLELAPAVESYCNNYLSYAIFSIYKEIQYFNNTISNHEERKEKITQKVTNMLSRAAKMHNTYIVKYILEDPIKFPIKLNNGDIMKFYKKDPAMLKYLFLKGYAPLSSSELNNILEDIANHPQNSHDSHILRKRNWVLEHLERLSNEDVTSLIGDFSTEIKQTLLDNNKALLESFVNTSKHIRKEFLIPLIEREHNNPPVLKNLQELIYNESDENYIKYILDTVINSLENTYLRKDMDGQYVGHAASTLEYFPSGNTKDLKHISIPQLLAVIKKHHLQRFANFEEKKELLISLYNKNTNLFSKYIEDAFNGLQIDDPISNISDDRTKFYTILEKLTEDKIDVLFRNATGQNINDIFQIQQLYKLCEAIFRSEINKDGPTCYSGFFARVTSCIADELDPSMCTKYDLYLEQINHSEKNLLTDDVIKEEINSFVDQLITYANEIPNLKVNLKNFMENQTKPFDLNNIPQEYNIVYKYIHNAFYDKYNRSPDYLEYILILENLSHNNKLQNALFDIFKNSTKEVLMDLEVEFNLEEKNNIYEEDTASTNRNEFLNSDNDLTPLGAEETAIS